MLRYHVTSLLVVARKVLCTVPAGDKAAPVVAGCMRLVSMRPPRGYSPRSRRGARGSMWLLQLPICLTVDRLPPQLSAGRRAKGVTGARQRHAPTGLGLRSVAADGAVSMNFATSRITATAAAAQHKDGGARHGGAAPIFRRCLEAKHSVSVASIGRVQGARLSMLLKLLSRLKKHLSAPSTCVGALYLLIGVERMRRLAGWVQDQA